MDEKNKILSNGRLQVWEKRWAENQLRWHKPNVNSYLIKYLDLLTSSQNPKSITEYEKAPKRFFIPLCGKTMDIAYLLSKGHTVFAIEGVKEAIEVLNKENSFDLLFDIKDSVYHTTDNRLKIYLGNIFTCPIEKWGQFDCIWDRGSLTAIDNSSWNNYQDIMRRSVCGSGNVPNSETKFQYLLVTFLYEKSKYEGKGPRCLDEDDLKSLYADWSDYHLLSSNPLPPSHIIRKSVGQVSPCFENVYLLNEKKLVL